MLGQLASIAVLVTSVWSHAALIKPAPRRLGDKFVETCGVDVAWYLGEQGGLGKLIAPPFAGSSSTCAKTDCFCR